MIRTKVCVPGYALVLRDDAYVGTLRAISIPDAPLAENQIALHDISNIEAATPRPASSGS